MTRAVAIELIPAWPGPGPADPPSLTRGDAGHGWSGKTMDDVLDAVIARDAAFTDEQAAGQPRIALVTAWRSR